MDNRSEIQKEWYEFVKACHEKIKKAATGHTILKVSYEDKKGMISTRHIEPYSFSEKGDLYAFCKEKNGIRQFKLQQFKSIENTNINFSPKYEIKIKP
ncbi:MAG: WYL domain-containing protein [Candidatus Paceibacterota bacterium]|jgi:predicted DNA-binding transcriptional regulator YafY